MRIHTVAADGGSGLHLEAGRFCAGPDSAGANTSPGCLHPGGPLSVMDANVMLGKLPPNVVQVIFGSAQYRLLDAAIVRESFAALAREVGDGRTQETAAKGFVTIAVENMTSAIKNISLHRGYDITE